MINIQFLESDDSAILGNYISHMQSIKIGTSKDCDIIINDPSMSDFHFLLDLSEKSLSITPHESVEYYLLNSKRTKNHKNIKIGDVVCAGSTKFKVINFLFTKRKSYEELLEEQMRIIFKEDKSLVQLLKDTHERENR